MDLMRSTLWRAGIVAIAVGSLTGWLVARTDFLHQLRSVSPGEWVQSLSGIVGVTATIAGTLWLERRKARDQAAADARMLYDVVQHLRSVCETVTGRLPDVTEELYRARTAGFYELIRTAMEQLEYEMQHYRIRDFSLWRGVHAVRTDYEVWKRELLKEERLVRDERATHAVARIASDRLAAFCTDILPAVKAAEQSLAG